MKKSIYLLIFFISVGLLNIKAEDNVKSRLKMRSKIDHVMVYKDRALITRKSKIGRMSPGLYEIIIRDLPYSIQDDSVRAEVPGMESIKILDVEVKSYQQKYAKDIKIRSLKENLEKLEEKMKEFKDKGNIIKFQKNYLYEVKESFLDASQKSDKKNKGTSPQLLIKDYNEMMSFLTDKLNKNLNDMRNLNRKKEALRIRINLIKGQMRKLNVNRSSIIWKKYVKVTAHVKEATSFTMELAYINFNTKWKPAYDIRIFFNKKKTEFNGYGIVSQKSGENWLNSRLSFSTARPSVRGWVPEIKPLYATIVSKRTHVHKDEQKYTGQQKKLSQAKQVGSLVFNVTKRADISGDGSPHRTPISRQTFPVSFEYICIPRLSPYAYLQVIGKNTMEKPILKGDLNIFIENDFVGSSYAGDILPGEKFELTLSVNENVRIKRTLEDKVDKKAGTFTSDRRLKYSFMISIENFSKQHITMNVLDQIPVSKSHDLEIMDVKFSHKPVMRNKRGIIKWTFKMAPKEKREIKFSFAVEVPKGKDLAFYKNKLKRKTSLQELNQMEIQDNIKNYKKGSKQKRSGMKVQMY
ncbi:mucoidy inhibitor MuiA family protein [Spirochaetota bacterium]